MPTTRIAIVSPFIDKRHGTERRIAEWISRPPREYEIHIYSQRVEDVDLTRMRWHRIPRIPGPHLINFLWWFAANHVWRWCDVHLRGLPHDVVYTAGTNCMTADLVSVHIVFAEFFRRVEPELKLSGNPLRFWPRLLHRRLYYRLIISLERHIYSNLNTGLILIARKTAADLKHFYGRDDPLPVVYIGLDHQIFNTESRLRNRAQVREQLGVADDKFALLLVGNDWKKKGLVAIIESLAQLRDLPIVLLVAGKDDRIPYEARIRELGLQGSVAFLPSRADVQWYYAAADTYVGPSLEDTFAQPPAEAMACGFPGNYLGNKRHGRNHDGWRGRTHRPGSQRRGRLGRQNPQALRRAHAASESWIAGIADGSKVHLGSQWRADTRHLCRSFEPQE